MLTDLIEKEKSVGVQGPDTNTIGTLARKFQKEGLEMSDINELKRIYERVVKLGYSKLINPDKVERATRIDDALRKWQFSEAGRRGFKDLSALNKETQAAKMLLNAIGKKYAGDANNAITLTDWIVLSGGNPQAVAGYIAKKALQEKGTQSAFAKWRYEGGTKTPLPSGVYNPSTKNLLLPSGTKGQGSQVFAPGVTKVAPVDTSAGKYESISGKPIAVSSRKQQPLPQSQKLSPKAYTPTIPQPKPKSNNILPKKKEIPLKSVKGGFIKNPLAKTDDLTAYHGTQAKEIRGTPNPTSGSMGKAFYLSDDEIKASSFGKEKNIPDDVVGTSGKVFKRTIREPNAYETSNVYPFDLSKLRIKTVANDKEFFSKIPSGEAKDASVSYRLMGYDGVYNKDTGTYAIYKTDSLIPKTK
jgi:hypothetical protein